MKVTAFSVITKGVLSWKSPTRVPRCVVEPPPFTRSLFFVGHADAETASGRFDALSDRLRPPRAKPNAPPFPPARSNGVGVTDNSRSSSASLRSADSAAASSDAAASPARRAPPSSEYSSADEPRRIRRGAGPGLAALGSAGRRAGDAHRAHSRSLRRRLSLMAENTAAPGRRARGRGRNQTRRARPLRRVRSFSPEVRTAAPRVGGGVFSIVLAIVIGVSLARRLVALGARVAEMMLGGDGRRREERRRQRALEIRVAAFFRSPRRPAFASPRRLFVARRRRLFVAVVSEFRRDVALHHRAPGVPVSVPGAPRRR